MKWVRIAGVGLGGLALLAWLAYWWLLGPAPVPGESDYFVDAQLVQASGVASLPGERPVRVNAQLVAEADLPRAAIMAGESLSEPHRMVHVAYQIVWANGDFVLIDAGFGRAYHREQMSGAPEGFFQDGYDAVQRALGRARYIVTTHEHGDHIGGIARYPQPLDLVGRLLMPPEQLDNSEQLATVDFPDTLRDALRDAPLTLEYARYYALAPGVVLIRAPGHTPGSQMVYVELASLERLLLIGDVAWHMDPIRQLRYRPRLVTDLFLGEDRDAVLAQYRRLHEIDAGGRVAVIPSHDAQRREELIATGLLGREFEGL